MAVTTFSIDGKVFSAVVSGDFGDSACTLVESFDIEVI